MSEFSAAWLALRRPHDAAARSAALARRFAAAVSRRAGGGAPWLLDLGAGTGANADYLAPLLPAGQRWALADRDAALLAEALPGRTRRPPALLALDLGRELARLDLDAFDGVTAAALMDLVSAAWFDRLARGCAWAGLPLLLALSYDGRRAWRPAAAEDTEVAARFDRHQRGDKGFGPALGPAAPAYLRSRLVGLGYRVETARADWRLGAADRDMLLALIDGTAEACGADAPVVEAWRRRRLAEARAGRLALRIGHLDLLARPPGL